MRAKQRQKTQPKATDQRLLDTAERLFARQGIRATSLREITEQTGINIAAVNYHFRSKEALVRAVFERNFRTLNEERLRCLAEAQAAAGAGPAPIESVLGALFEPMLRAWKQNRDYILLSGRLLNEPDPRLHEFILGLYDEVIRRFLAAALRALPGASEPDLFFWLHYLFGGMVHTLLAAQDLERLPGGSGVLDDTEKFLDRLVTFGSAALRSMPGAQASKLGSPRRSSTVATLRIRKPSSPHLDCRKDAL